MIKGRYIMEKNEIDILMKIAKNKYSFRQLMSSRVAIDHPYIGCLIDSLLKRGYLKGSRAEGYQLTSKSNRAVKEHLKVNEGSNNIVFFNLRRNHKAIAKMAIQSDLPPKNCTSYNVSLKGQKRGK